MTPRPRAVDNQSDAFDPPKITSGGTLADRVTAVLTEQIKGGEFPSGSRLPTEQVMAERFGVSRTVVRESVSRLKSDGLVEVRQGSGIVVREANMSSAFRLNIDPQDSIEAVLRVTELRRGVEAEAAALAAQRHTRSQLADIRRALLAIDAATKRGDDGVDEDVRFHMAISHATGNSLYPSLVEFISQFIRAAIRVTRSNEARRADFASQVRAEHTAMFEAIAARDPDAARLATCTHIDNAGARIKVADAEFWAQEGAKAAEPLIKQAASQRAAAGRRK
jgi:GntR family transcriptional regulator, transcriptional repressor for pyruvate dehydrogenase complex